MSRYSLSESRWSGLPDWPIVGVSQIPNLEAIKFYRFGSVLTGSFHTFVDDWRLEAIWRDSGLKRERVTGLVCTAPDFSVFWDDPLPHVQYQVWRSRVVAAQWQRAGAVVIPVIQFASEISWSLCVRGVCPCSVLAIRGPSKTDDIGRWRAACIYWLEAVQPSLVIQFGRCELSA